MQKEKPKANFHKLIFLLSSLKKIKVHYLKGKIKASTVSILQYYLFRSIFYLITLSILDIGSL